MSELFPHISPEVEQLQRVESLCMLCHEQGETRMLLCRIPHFRDVVVSAFSCEHCGARSSDLMDANDLSPFGVKVTVKIDALGLNRQVVRSEHCTLKIEEIDLEMPPRNGVLTTVEGLLRTIVDDLKLTLSITNDEAVKSGLPRVLACLDAFLNGAAFTLVLNDPSGNSYIEALDNAPCNIEQYTRTREQTLSLGFAVPDATQAPEEVMEFPAHCSVCGADNATRMKMVDIPFFKQILLMSTTCDQCGFKSNEVKSGGAVNARGRKLTLAIDSADDMSRDVLKSESASISVPEIGLDMCHGTLGGRFTTIEGLLMQVHDELRDKSPFSRGDSETPERKERFESLLQKIKSICAGELKCTLVLDDPLANSYIQNVCAPDADPQLQCEEYERTFEQNEALGLNDMITEDYETVE